MAWVKLSDDYMSQPEIVAAGDAVTLSIAGLCYSNAQMKDGRLTRAEVSRLFAGEGKSPIKMAGRLVEANVWLRDGEGYRIHDRYLQHQPTAEEMREQRKRNAERQAKFRANHGKGNSESNALLTDNVGCDSLDGNACPVPVPGFVPDIESTVSGTTVQDGNGHRPRPRAVESEIDGPFLKHRDAPKFIAMVKTSYITVYRSDWIEASVGYVGMLDETLTSVSWEKLSTLWHCFLLLCKRPDAERPFDKPTLWNFLRSAVAETEVKARKLGLLDEHGQLAKTPEERCAEAGHKRWCGSEAMCRTRQRQDRDRAEMERIDAERAAAIAAAGGEEAYQAKKAAERKAIWDTQRARVSA